jgi:hypothetical protein
MRRLVVLFSAATLSLVGGVIATSAVASGSTAPTEPSSAVTEAAAATEAPASTAGAAETTEAAVPSTAPHPLVGAWLVDDTPAGGALYVASFQSDGVYQQVASESGGIGVWEATGPNSGAVTALIPFSDGQGGGVVKCRATFEVSSDGQSVTIDYYCESFRHGAPTGDHSGPGTQTGTRINVEPMGTSEDSATSAPTTSN